ncbi:MAG: mannose-1-phosphate guanylyltransferase/mannose-6-phosphate isomerase [Legionellaceae bacterium]
MDLIPVILCGGVGSRLWPVSRETHPKPFIKLYDGQSLLQKTLLRALDLPGVRDIVVATNRDLFFKTEDEFREVNTSHCTMSYILEPFGRNTAAAIAMSALQLAKTHGKDALMLVLPADHLIVEQAAFALAVSQAMGLAREGKLVTFGIQPESPETGYGYIEAEGNEVIKFIEKPALEQATAYVESGRFLWNAGMFCFTAQTLLDEMKQHCPEILEATTVCFEQSRCATGEGFMQRELDAHSFGAVPDNSIDYAVIEKSSRVAVVPSRMGWSDIGSWDAFGGLSTANSEGNCIEGEALLCDVSNTYIRSHDRLVGVVGVDNLLIIDTPDALLVADKTRAQDVKQIYAELKAMGHESHKIHRTVHRPWGTYTILEEGPRFKIKRIEVRPGASLSLQMHHHRSEHWIVVSGMARVVNGDKEMFVRTNESTYIPAGHRHRLENPGVRALVMIEVQSGEYMGEDDIVRFEDVYGRV